MSFKSVAKIDTNLPALDNPTHRSAYNPDADAYLSLREAVENGASTRSWLGQIVRSGILFIVLFEIGGVLGLSTAAPTKTAAVFPFEIFNVLAGAVCLYITWTVWFSYNWRLLVFGFCALVIAGASYLSLATGQTEPLLMSVILLLVAGGSLMPWNARWQGVLTFLCLSWFGINAMWSGNALHGGWYQWLGLLGAGALAYSGAQLGDRYRAELKRQLESLRASHSRLRAEFANYIARAEDEGLRVDHERADKLMAETQKKLRHISATTARSSSFRRRLHLPVRLTDAHPAA